MIILSVLLNRNSFLQNKSIYVFFPRQVKIWFVQNISFTVLVLGQIKNLKVLMYIHLSFIGK